MAKIQFNVGVSAPDTRGRRTVDEIIGGEGASPRGSSFYKSAQMCAREHALVNVYNIRPAGQNEAFAIGTIFHKALEVYYKFIQAEQQALDANNALRMANEHYYFGCTFEAQQAAWAAIAPMATEPGYSQTWEAAQKCIEAYFEKYAGLDRWRILAVEETLQYTDEGFDFSARLDLVVESEGRTWLVEHKTAKAVSADSLDHYDMDMQTLGQQWLFNNCVDTSKFSPLAGCIVNIVTKHKVTQTFRKEVCPSQAHLDMFEDSIRSLYAMRVEMERNEWPRSLGHCAGAARGYGKCQFFDGCRNWPSWSAEKFAANLPDGFVIVGGGADDNSKGEA